MTKEVSILIVDDHNVVQEGLKYILKQKSEYQFKVFSAKDEQTCMQQLLSEKIDIILMDVNLGDESGIDLTKRVIDKFPDQKIIAITMHEEEYVIKQMLKAGAMGYLLKNTSYKELKLAFESVLSGEIYCSYQFAINMFNPKKLKQSTKLEKLKSTLSDREKEILRMIVDEMTNEEIASKLKLSKRTVDGHRQNIINKLDVRNTAGLVKFAIEANV